MKNLKILKIISLCTVVVSFVFFVLGLIMPLIVLGTGENADSTATGYVTLTAHNLIFPYIIMLALGFVFIITIDNKVIKNLGKGFMAGVSVIAFITFFEMITNMKQIANQNAGVGASIGFGSISFMIGIAFYALYLIFEWVKFIVNNDEVTTDIKDPIEELKRWKELLDNNTITEEEFNFKKQEILKIEKKD